MMLEGGTLLAFGLYLTRCAAMILSSPPFGTASGFSGYKVAIVGALALLFYMSSGVPLPETVGPFEYLLLMMREMTLGVLLGFIVQAIMLALRVAGEVVGHGMGLNMAGQVDPVSGVNTPLITRVYETFYFIGFLAVDGHHWLIRALGSTFERAPIGAMGFDRSLADFVRGLFTQMFTAGLSFAAPILVVLALVSILTGLLSRAVPQLNVLEVSFTLRVAFALIAMLLFAPMLAPAMSSLYETLQDNLEGAILALESDDG